jgi:hypothetical protein
MPFPFSLYSGLSYPVTNYPIDRRDLLDYQGSNTIQSARYINPQTGDFEVSANNLLMGQNAIEQQVLLAINTTFNSAVLKGFGQQFGNIKLLTPNIQNQVVNIINNALSYLIQNNLITIQKINSTVNNFGQLQVQFVYNNNTLGTQAPITFIIEG